MKTMGTGSRVTLHYIGTLDNGRIFDSADEANPLVFTVGAGEVFAALERGLIGLRQGESKNLLIPADEAYGPAKAENVITVARSMFPADRELQVGQKLRVQFGASERIMRIAALGSATVTLDGNHPLAGLDLTFALKLVRVE